jgi:pyridoxamine 5'-phosphate oxidase
VDKFSDIRKEYARATLDEASVNNNPVAQLEKWLDDAIHSNALEPSAMNLATIAESGRPASRIVLLKGINKGKLYFYTNYQSQKGKDLDANPACALNFFWPELERQVRVAGIAERASAEESDTYFHSRPLSSQIGAWASPQSSAIKNRTLLEARVKDIEKRFAGMDELPRPKQWGGYRVVPVEIEFWQGRASRLHDRILFTLIDGKWVINRLAP